MPRRGGHHPGRDTRRLVLMHSERTRARREYAVDEHTGCWVWQRTVNAQTGYGMAYRAHRGCRPLRAVDRKDTA
jgi:hypothetical protein